MKKAGSQKANKSKHLTEYHQVEDKIYTFLTELGTIRGRKEISRDD